MKLKRETDKPQFKKMRKTICNAMKLDHSISNPEFGSLFTYDEETPLGETQKGIADYYDVAFAYPSVTGTTALNLIAILTVAFPGDQILIQRDSHVSVLAGLINGGLNPVYLSPSYSEELGIPLGVTPDQVNKALEKSPNIKVVLLTYPNYFGVAGDIREIVNIVDEHNAFLIVDSAHGSHWAFSSGFPCRPEIAGAKMVTLSIHKTGLSMGQGSLLLLNDPSLIGRLYEAASLGFVSTSFSTVILTSLVDGILQLVKNGQPIIEKRLEMATWARNEINKIDGLHSFGQDEILALSYDLDPLRLTIDVSGIGLTGYEVEHYLIEKSQIYAEMATLQNVLFLINPGIGWKDITRLVRSLKELSCSGGSGKKIISLPIPERPKIVIPPREAFYSKCRKSIPLRSSIGKVSAETISAYPPGSAVIVSGEIITEEIIDYLAEIKKQGGTLKGATDESFTTIQIIDC